MFFYFQDWGGSATGIYWGWGGGLGTLLNILTFIDQPAPTTRKYQVQEVNRADGEESCHKYMKFIRLLLMANT